MSDEISSIEVKKVKKVVKKKKVTIEESSLLSDGSRRESEVEIVEVTKLDSLVNQPTVTEVQVPVLFPSFTFPSSHLNSKLKFNPQKPSSSSQY